MQYTIASVAVLARFAAAVPHDYYGASSSTTPAAYAPTTPAAYSPTTEAAPKYYSTTPAAYTTTTEKAPEYYSSTTEEAPKYYSSSAATPPAYYPSSSSSASAYYPTTSAYSACPAPGDTDDQGRYSCNPARQYPEGQYCSLLDGCYYLRTEGPGVSAVPYTTTQSQYETYCPTPTTITAHSKTYTVTKATTLTICPGNCVYSTVSLPPPVYTTSTVSAYTTVCPSPTTIYTHGQTYPVTKPSQTVTICKDACTVTAPSMPSGSAYACPAPGSTDSMGRYSCNPAHQYPAGQTCQLVDSCYFLITPKSPAAPQGTGSYKPAGNGTSPTKPVAYTGGAAGVAVTAVPVALFALAALFL